MTAHPAKFSSASSRARIVFTSRSFVGSSRSRTFAPCFQHLCEMHSVAFSARKSSHLLLLIGTMELNRAT